MSNGPKAKTDPKPQRPGPRVSPPPEPPDPAVFLAGVELPVPADGSVPICDLPPKQALLLVGIMRGMTVAESAANAGLTYFYARQLVSNPGFKEAQREIIKAMRDDLVSDMRSLGGIALRRQRDLLVDWRTPPVVVAQVARDILDRLKLSEEVASQPVEAAAPMSDTDAAKAIAAAQALPPLPDEAER